MNRFLSQSQSSCQPRLGPDAGESHPGGTAGESRMFQGEGAPSRTPLVPPSTFTPLAHDSRAPQPEPSGRAPPRSPSYAAPRPSARQAPRPPPPFGAPPQPSTSGWVPPGPPPPPRSRRDSSESEASDNECHFGSWLCFRTVGWPHLRGLPWLSPSFWCKGSALRFWGLVRPAWGCGL